MKEKTERWKNILTGNLVEMGMKKREEWGKEK
jgi:hypothetical protein